MENNKLNSKVDNLLLDPFFIDEHSCLLKYGIPFFKDDCYLYILNNSDNKKTYNISNIKIKTVFIDKEDLYEKQTLIKQYKKWIEEKCFNEKSAIRIVLDFILIQAILKNSSDIHFEFVESGCVVKFKIDTVLSNQYFLNKQQYEAVLIRLKVLSSLEVSNKLTPQSSSFFRSFRNKNIDFRFSTHPTILGQRSVIRVLQQKNVFKINELGLSDDVFSIVQKVVNEPSGLVVFTGPTNSGKTTTIHSILKEISKNNLNIMTLEDPVEYRIPGIVQTNITESGLSFFDGMKSILRQDPDVIFLGEIRDAKTAQVAVQAAMTGHKVLTTLHSYSTKGAVSRLNDMGISLSMLAESLLAVFSQRLVRKVQNNGFSGLALVSDAFLFDEAIKDILRSGNIPDIKNNLYALAKVLVEKNITTKQEVNRVIGCL